MSIREEYRFRYSPTSDLAIGRDDQGHPWFQSWAPDPETGARATKPLGWSAYRPHSGLEEAEEVLRLKAELALVKAKLDLRDRLDAALGGAGEGKPDLAKLASGIRVEVGPGRVVSDQRHRDLVELAAASLAGQWAYPNPMPGGDSDMWNRAAADAFGTLAAIDAAEKKDQGA